MAAGVGPTVGPPWGEGVRIYPKSDNANLSSRIGLIVTGNQDDLNQTTVYGFKVMMDGQTTIRNTTGINSHLTIIGTGGQGANIFLLGDGGTTPQKFLRASAGDFQILNSSYATTIMTLSDAGHVGFGGNYDTGTGIVMKLTDTGPTARTSG